MANDKPLFPKSDPYGLGNSVQSLFPQDRPMRAASTSGASAADRVIAAANKAPTKAQAKAAEDAAQTQFYDGVRANLNAMRETPEWQNASLERRKEMRDKWQKEQYDPYMKQFDDPAIRKELRSLLGETINADITNLEKSIDDSSRLSDIGTGVRANTNRLLDSLPMSASSDAINLQYMVDTIEKAKKEGRSPTTMEIVGNPFSTGTAGFPVDYITAAVLGEDWDNLLEGAKKELATANAKADWDENFVKNLENTKSVRASNANVRSQELTDEYGGFTGTLVNAVTSPVITAGHVVEQAPQIGAGIASIAAGPLGMALTGGTLSEGDAKLTARDIITNTPDDVLQQRSPAYKALRAELDENAARRTLANRAGAMNAAAFASGFLTGPIGAEAVAAKALARQGIAETTKGKVIQGGVGLLSGGVDNAVTQYSANTAVNDAADGLVVDPLHEVASAGAEGLIIGGGIIAPAAGVAGIRSYRERRNGGNDQAPPAPQEQTTEGAINEIMDVPSAAEAAQATAETQTTTTPNDAYASPEIVASVQETFAGLRERQGQTVTTQELAPAFEKFYDAQTNGIPNEAITLGLDAVNNERAMAPESGFPTLVDAYNDYVVKRTAHEVNEAATESVANIDTIAETIANERADAGTTGRANDDSTTGDSTVATVTERDGAVTPESINDAIRDGDTVETTTLSGAERDGSSTNESNAVNDAQLGIIEPAIRPDSRPDNSGDATTATQRITSERVVDGTTRQSTADGGGAAGSSVNTVGSNPRLEVGQKVTFQAAFPNAPERKGTVESINDDGTFNMREGGSVLGNLPQSGIKAPVDAAPATTAPPLGVIEPANVEQVSQSPIEQVQEERVGSTTPEGRDVERMDAASERLYEQRDGAYGPDAAEMQSAIERGDMATVDQIASYLYSQGLRQFAPPNKPTGAAKQSFTQQMERLSSFDREIIQNEYNAMKGALPPEARDFESFTNTVVQDALLVADGGSPLSAVYNRLSKFARDVVNKIAKGLAAIALVVTLSNTFPINDAVAAQGGASVATVTQTQGLSKTANTVNSWVAQSKDNAGQKYIIADKATGEVHIMNADGSVIATAPALYGKKIGDGMSIGETPAGIFTLTHSTAPKSYGGDVLDFATAPDGDLYAIHRVLTNNPKQNRLGRLASKTADDNRISLGCINLPADIYDQHLTKGFKGKLYIIPDQKELGQVFKGIEEIEAKQDLRAGEVLPDDFQDPTSNAYESSTQVKAEVDAMLRAPEDGSSLTTAAAEMSMGISESPMAAYSTSAADTGLASAAMLPFMVMWRNRKKVSDSGKLGDESNNTDGETAKEQGATPTPEMGPNAVNGEMRHTVASTDASTASTTPRTTRDWVTSSAVSVAEKLSDSSRRFRDWTSQFNPAGREVDSHPVYVAYKLAANQIRQMQQTLMQNHLEPLAAIVRRVSQDRGVGIDVVGDHFGTWATLQHIPEANAVLRRRLQERVTETMFTDPTEYANAAAALQAFDAYQAGRGEKVPMAGGLTDAQAQVISRRIEGYGYNVEDLQAFQQSAVTSFQTLLQERIEAGVVTEDQAQAWREGTGFKNYVPLYVDKSNETGGDVFMGSSMYNPAGDHERSGSMSPANHAFVTMHQYISRTAAGIGSMPFKQQLHALYTQLHAAGDTVGLRRIAVNSPYVSEADRKAVGFIYRDPYINAEDQEAFHTYKYTWDDPRVAEGMMRSNMEDNLSVLRNMSAITNVHARLITKYDPSFAPFNWVRDGWERATSITSKELYDADGNSIGVGKAARKLYVSALNPIHVAKIAANIINPNAFANSETILAMQELRNHGGLTTYNNALAMNAKDMRSSLKRTTGLRRHVAMLDNFFTQWNEAFGAAPAVGAYMALTEMGVPAREAAFRVLDTFNTNNKGEWTGTMKAFSPFVVPAIEGGRNMIRNLSSKRGRLVFAGQVALAISLYGAMKAFAPDDPETGNAMDNMSLSDMSRFIPLYNKDGSYAKLPVSFGMSRLAWIVGAGSYRISAGTYDNAAQGAGDLLSNVALAALQEVQPFDFAKDVYSDNLASGVILSAIPAIAQPFAEVALNTNHFGSRIHSNTPAGGFASDSAMTKTAEVWTDIATTMQKTFGIDAYPESYRHLLNGYAVGPARAIGTMLEADTNYTFGGRLRTRQEIGPVWDAVGIARYFDNGVTANERQYYNNIDKYNDILRKYHVSASDSDNKPGQKAISAYNRILEAGGSDREAMIVYSSIEAETARAKMNKGLRKQVVDAKKMEYDLKELAPEYEEHVQDMEALMRDYNSNIRSIPQ